MGSTKFCLKAPPCRIEYRLQHCNIETKADGQLTLFLPCETNFKPRTNVVEMRLVYLSNDTPVLYIKKNLSKKLSKKIIIKI